MWAEASRVFSILAQTENEEDCLLDKKAVLIILNAMELNQFDIVLQELSCTALANVSENRQMLEFITSNGGVELVTQALKRFTDSKEVSYSSLYFLENASRMSKGMFPHCILPVSTIDITMSVRIPSV